ncbi:MAG: glycosyltransferase family 4 protein [Kiritimatiellia bacterium]
MKILILMETEVFSGPAKNLLETLKLLRGQVEFEVATYLRGNAQSSAFIDAFRGAGFSVHVVRERFRYDPSTLGRLRRIMRDVSPDIVQVHNSKSRLFITFLRRGLKNAGIREVHYFHGETWVDRKQHFYNLLDRALFRCVPNVVVVAEYQKRLLCKWGVPEGRIAVIYNGIGVQTETVPASGRDKGFLLAVGRLSREKGHCILLEAVQLLQRRGVNGFKLHVVGEGPERSKLERCITEKKLGAMVCLEGYRSDPSDFYGLAGLFILPSMSEGFPNVLLEAAMHGVPVISFDVGGIPEIFRNGEEAVLLSDHSAEALADAMQDYLRNPDNYREMAAHARARIVRDFSLEAKAKRLLEYYKEILAQRR